MTRGFRLVERWFFAPQPQHAMVVARMGFGLILFGAYAARVPWLQSLFGPQGVGGADILERAPQIVTGRNLEVSFQLLNHVTAPAVIWVLYVTLLVSALCFAAGFRTRLSGSLLLILHLLFQARNYAAFSDWAVMIKPWLFYVLLSHGGMYFSLDAARRGVSRPASEWLGPGWPIRLLQIHLCLMYAVPGWSRLLDPVWYRGEMLYQLLTDRWWGRFDLDWTPFLPGLKLLTWGTFVLEPLAPFLLFVPRIGPWYCLALIGLHLGMELLTNADMWQPMMIVALFVFLPASWIARLLGRRTGD